MISKQNKVNIRGECFTNSEDITSFNMVWSHEQNLFKVKERPFDIVLIIKAQTPDQKGIRICLIWSENITVKSKWELMNWIYTIRRWKYWQTYLAISSASAYRPSNARHSALVNFRRRAAGACSNERSQQKITLNEDKVLANNTNKKK